MLCIYLQLLISDDIQTFGWGSDVISLLGVMRWINMKHISGLILGWLHFFLSTVRFIKPYLVEPDVCHPEDMLSSWSQQHHV